MFQIYTWIWGWSGILFLRSSGALSGQMGDFRSLQGCLIGFYSFCSGDRATWGHSELSLMLCSHYMIWAQSADCQLVFALLSSYSQREQTRELPQNAKEQSRAASPCIPPPMLFFFFLFFHYIVAHKWAGLLSTLCPCLWWKTSAHTLRSHISCVISCISFWYKKVVWGPSRAIGNTMENHVGWRLPTRWQRVT